MPREITSAVADWDQSIIERSAIDDLFSKALAIGANDHPNLEAAKLILIKQTTKLVWTTFDGRLSGKDISSARKLFDQFEEIVERAAYRPPAAALRSLRNWLTEEEKAIVTASRPPSHFDIVAYPWLIAFFRIVFEQPAGMSLPGQNARFIQSYFGKLAAALASGECIIMDPEGRARDRRPVPLIKSLDAVSHAAKKYTHQADQYMALIGQEIAAVAICAE